MKITLTRTGGFTGIPYRKMLDTSTLSEDKRKELEELVKNNPIIQYTNNPIEKLPDQFTYTISIASETINKEVTIAENQITKPMQKLINYIQKNS